MTLDAIVLLGCRVYPFGRPSGTAMRRADRAAQAWHDGLAPLVVVSGGRRWHGVREADALADYLEHRRGVPKGALLCERRSLSTAENARYSARLLGSRGLVRIGVVTSDWHMTRAIGAFRRTGLSCEPLPVRSAPERLLVRACRSLREAASLRLERWLMRGRP